MTTATPLSLPFVLDQRNSRPITSISQTMEARASQLPSASHRTPWRDLFALSIITNRNFDQISTSRKPP